MSRGDDADLPAELLLDLLGDRLACGHLVHSHSDDAGVRLEAGGEAGGRAGAVGAEGCAVLRILQTYDRKLRERQLLELDGSGDVVPVVDLCGVGLRGAHSITDEHEDVLRAGIRRVGAHRALRLRDALGEHRGGDHDGNDKAHGCLSESHSLFPPNLRHSFFSVSGTDYDGRVKNRPFKW